MAPGKQAIKIIHVSDIHFGSGEGHGRINPDTGLNVRFEDFVKALQKTVDYSLEQKADVFLFSGDAYKNASPEPIYQKMFAVQLRRLSDAGVKIILLVGNHDQIMRSNISHSMSVFQSLAVPNLTTIDEPRLITVDTAHGAFQLIGIPHVTRHLLMTHEKYASLSGSEIEKTLATHVRSLVEDLCDELNPSMPAVLTAHMMVDRARAGGEQELMIGYSMTFPVDMLMHERLDYVALGHVHKYQILNESNPAIVYAGSLERVDFGEQSEDKGFIEVDLRRQDTTFKFHSIEPRPFVTVDVDLTESHNPTAALCAALKEKIVAGCVMRLRYKVRQEQVALLDEHVVRELCAEALSVQFKPEILTVQRDSRIPQLNESAVNTPLAALETYLTQMAPERKEQLLEKARDLCAKLDKDS